jgi:DMSO/TMAO reductase YedYZ molybdopterin-dependent catalytic subunit
MAVGAPNAAYNKAKRLKAVELVDETSPTHPVRRTPEAVVRAERRLAAEEAAERRAQERAQRRHEFLVPVATGLLEHRDALLRDDDVDYWLEEIEAVLAHCQTPLQMMSLHRYLDAALRALAKLEKQAARSVARTEEARLAVAAAVELQRRQQESDEAASFGAPGRPITP